MANEVASGIAGGVGSGAAVGTSVLPGWGTLAGAVIGGIAGGISGGQAKKKADAAAKADKNLSVYDPMQVALLEKIRNQRKMFQMGTDPTTAYRNRLALQTGATTASNVERIGGPDAINGLLRAQANTNSAIQSNGAAGANYGQDLLSMEGSLTGHLADYAQNLQMQRRNEALARSEQARQDINSRFTASLAALPSISSQFRRQQQPSLNSSNIGLGSQLAGDNARVSYAPSQYENRTPGSGASPYSLESGSQYGGPTNAVDQNLSNYGQ